MKLQRAITTFGLVLMLAWACDDNQGPATDGKAPGRVGDFAVTGATATTLTLEWTAPGDDGNLGQAESYVLRRSGAIIDASNFAAATTVAGVPAPRHAGMAESFTVTGLDSTVSYYFAIRARDEAGNAGAVSNNATWPVHAVKDLAPVKDNTIFEEGDYSNGVGEFLFTGENAGGIAPPPDARRALLYFDIANSIPAGATIDSVRLTIHISKAAPHAPGDNLRVATLHRLTADWGEGASNAGDPGGTGIGAEPGDATWTYRLFNTTAWTTPGGDFDATASATKMLDVSGFATFSSAQMAADVQLWLDTPAADFGWVVVGDESQTTTARRLDSREHTTPANRPKLTVYYSP